MAGQQQWFADKPEYETFGLAQASDTEAYAGHMGKARELTRRALDSAVRTNSRENGAVWQAIAAQWEAAYGNPAEARRAAAEALKLAPASQSVEVEAAIAFAKAGDTVQAESLAQLLGKQLSAGHPDAVALAACDSGTTGAGQKESGYRSECPAICFAHRVGQHSVRHQSFLPLSDVHSWRSILGSRTGQLPPPPSFRRFSTTAASSGHLLDGSLGAFGRGSRQCFAVEELTGS